jgi:tRNA (adenine57-N1/adenine58-N1)-methyltransferase
MNDPDGKRYVFREGDHALVLDRKGRRYLVELERSADFHTHLGNISHDELIGETEGVRVVSSRDHALLAVKPTMADFTKAMPRIATVVYPKDLGPILVHGDIFPGAKVLEAGAGSGAVTIALLRAIGDRGSLASYDLRADMIERTRSNVNAMIPDPANLVLKQGDVYEGFEERELDRIVLDLPEPWRVVPHAAAALAPGGIFLSFLPTVLQVHDLTLALKADGSFDIIETTEVMMRTWSVGRRSVRPDHRMVGHTGFITTARRCSPRLDQADAPDDAAATQ